MIYCKLKVSEKGGFIFSVPICIDQNSKKKTEREGNHGKNLKEILLLPIKIIQEHITTDSIDTRIYLSLFHT